MLNFLLSLINPLGAVAEKLADAYAKKADAQTDQERIRADVEIERLKLRERLLLEEASHWLTRWIRPAFAYPAAFYVGKILVWDKALGLGASDPLDENMLWVLTAIVSFYFLTRPIEKIWRK